MEKVTDYLDARLLRRIRTIGIPIGSLLAYILFSVVTPSDEPLTNFYQKNGWWLIGVDLFILFVIISTQFEAGRWASGRLERWLPWSNRPLLRAIAQLLAQLLFSVLIVTTLFWLLTKYYPLYLLSQPDGHTQYTVIRVNESDYIFSQSILFITLLALLITSGYIGLTYLNRWKAAVLESERLKRQSLEVRYQLLKNQLDPHFLFNTFATLANLAEETPERVSPFVAKLSLIYRFVLQTQDKLLVPLADEIRLVEAYVYLLQSRFDGGLQTRIDVPNEVRHQFIPPMTLQLLLENAVKHNIVSEEQPLLITISIGPNGRLRVQNSLNRLPSQGEPSGFGLANIQQRYELLNEHYPGTGLLQLIDSTDQFTVEVPLIAYVKTSP